MFGSDLGEVNTVVMRRRSTGDFVIKRGFAIELETGSTQDLGGNTTIDLKDSCIFYMRGGGVCRFDIGGGSTGDLEGGATSGER